jgi:hypothetical protein
MPQSADKILDHAPLFREPEYKEMLARKAEFENMPPAEQVTQIADWTKSWDYREKNFAREALSVNPAKACQPLGAVFVASGFERTMSFVHGSQGCVAYYRSHLSRHFKEPSSAVSSSMTEDAAVFWRAEQHGGRSGQHLPALRPEDDRRFHHLHGRSYRRRPERLHFHSKGKRVGPGRL